MIMMTKVAPTLIEFAESLTVRTACGSRPFGEVMADHQRKDFEALTPALLSLARGEIAECQRFWIERTKKSSKDTDAGIAILWLLRYSPIELDIQVAAGDLDQSGEIRKRMSRILFQNPDLLYKKVRDKEKGFLKIDKLQISNVYTGSLCTIISSDPKTAHGATPDLLLINEVSHIESEDFVNNLQDNAAGVPNNVTIILTNAGFRPSWQFNLREEARTSPRWYFSKFDKIAPWIEPEEVEERRRVLSVSRFIRLWGGNWVTGDENSQFTESDVDRITTLPGPMPVTTFDCFTIGTLDVGTRKHHTAFCVLEIDIEEQKIRLAECLDWKPTPYRDVQLIEDVEPAIIELHRSFNFSVILYDPKDAIAITQRLYSQHGIFVIKSGHTSKHADECAQAMMHAINNRVLEIFPHELLKVDILKINIQDRLTGYKLTAPDDAAHGHADRAMSIALGLPMALVAMSDLGLRNEMIPGMFPAATESLRELIDVKKRPHYEDNVYEIACI